ncbi:hypothetical protein BAE44_0007443 [Dichanthelium oligosanthes]|uniref:Uncharacterized protein n=1 Tax=Dichanthelium oligosanthes TaxID=888268 RepID=A0A1E5W292_9POAL|nr:hypothetical protein BAE44_0007443 [Dichanthelium oligosanthes]
MASSPAAKKEAATPGPPAAAPGPAAATPGPPEPPKGIDFTKPPGKAEQIGGGEEWRPRKRGRKPANGREEPLGRGLASWSPPPKNSTGMGSPETWARRRRRLAAPAAGRRSIARRARARRAHSWG